MVLKEGEGVKGQHQKLPGFFSGAPESRSSHQIRPGWMLSNFGLMRRCGSVTPAYNSQLLLQLHSELIQIFTPKLPMLNSRLTKIYKAPYFQHSAVYLCTTVAPLIWSESMKVADSPRHQTDVFDQTAACRADMSGGFI